MVSVVGWVLLVEGVLGKGRANIGRAVVLIVKLQHKGLEGMLEQLLQ